MDEPCIVGSGGSLHGERAGDVAWWSYGKTVSAVAALRLVERGALTLDAPLRARSYSLRQLLQHRAGLPDYGALPAYHDAVDRELVPWTATELRAQLAVLPNAPIGEFLYSNLGYLEVRECIEAATGQPLDSALRELVLEPAGVPTVRLARLPQDLIGVSGVAPGYHPGWVYPGLLVGKLADAARLLHQLVSGVLLPADMWQELSRPHVLPGRAEPPWSEAAYGLGLMTPRVAGGRQLLGHTGSGPGSSIAVYAEQAADGVRVAAATSERKLLSAVERAVVEALQT